MQNTYSCTRPRLAAELISKGYTPSSITANPWRPERTMWIFPLSKELADAVSVYFETEQKPIPNVIANYLRGIN